MPATLRSVLQTTLSALRRPSSTDADLLAAFATVRDEAAFAELVRRHGALVLGASLRTVGDRGTAEDVFQATFLLLARKADSISWGPTVAPWLYQAVRRIGAKARAGAARRSFSPIPRDVPAPAADPAAGLARAELRAALDDALAALPARLRDPLVLCYLEGLTQDEAAAVLGCPPATIKGRVTRGRERLRKLLQRRGLSLSVALSGLLASEPFVVAGTASATARAATVYATTGAASPKVLALLCGTSAGVKLAAGLFGLVLACAAVAAGMVGGSPGPKAWEKRVVRAAPRAPVPGEALPAGAVARLGTRWLCGPELADWVGFSPDGKRVASKGHNAVSVWDATTGRPLVQRTDCYVRNTPVWRADGTGIAVVMRIDGSYRISACTDPDEKFPLPKPAAPNPNPDALESFALSADGTRLAVGRNAKAKHFTIDLLAATPGRAVSDLKRERTLGPFEGPLQELRYTTDGRLMFLAGKDKAAGEWSLSLVDPVKNKVSRTTSIPRPGSSVWRHMLSLSADGRLAAFAPGGDRGVNGHEATIRVWDLVAGKELWSFPFPKSGYGTGHAFTPDGKHLITSTSKVFFQVWDLATGKESARSPLPAGSPFSTFVGDAVGVGVSPDGKRFATVRSDGRVDVWHTATGKPVIPLDTHRDYIDAVDVSPDGRLGATLSYDGTVRVWELATGKAGCVIPAPLERREAATRRLAFTPDGRGLLFPADGKLAMASPETGRRLELPRNLRDYSGTIGGFTANGKTLMTFDANKVQLWAWPAGTVRVAITALDERPGPKGRPHRVAVHKATLSPDGRFAFTNSVAYADDPAKGGGQQGTNDLWDARTGKRLHQMSKPLAWYPPAAFAPDSRVMYLGGHSLEWPAEGRKVSDSLTAWDTATGKLLRRFEYSEPEGDDRRMKGFGRMVDPLAVSSDGRLLAAGSGGMSGDRNVWVYEVATGNLIKKLAGHSRSLKALAFSSDGRRLVSVSEDQTGLVWDVTVPALAGKPAEMSLADAWVKLADPDPVPAYAAMASLVADPARAVPLLRKRLRPAPTPTDADVDRVIARLDADTFAEREKASADLDRLGPNAAPRTEARLGGKVSPEARGRLSRFLRRHAGPAPSPHHLRCVRGVAAVEAIGTASARALLAEWAKGPKDDPLTREAEAAMGRK